MMTGHRIDSEPNTPAPEPAPADGRDYDDGLVHENGWACHERGAPAH